MTLSLYILIPISLVLVVVAIWAFFWAADSGQFDDMDTPAWKIILDDDSKLPEESRPVGPLPREEDRSHDEY